MFMVCIWLYRGTVTIINRAVNREYFTGQHIRATQMYF